MTYIFLGVISSVALLVITFWTRQTEYIQRNRDWVPQSSDFNGITIVMVPLGCFTMGNLQGRDNEKPTEKVCFEQVFWIGEHEVTAEEFGSPPDEACNTNQLTGSDLVNGTEGWFPRNCVTWQESLEFCQEHGMRLPTEAEWEYAGRGPDNVLYPWGNDANPIFAIVRMTTAAPGQMFPVGSKPQAISWVGATDMTGSLREFTSTIYDTVTDNGEIRFPYPYKSNDGRESLESYGTSADRDNRGNTTTLRVVRGGSFDHSIDRSTLTFRSPEYYDFRWNAYGFRCAVDKIL